MSGYVKYLKNGGKKLSFIIEDDNELVKYIEIWNKIKKTLNIKFHSMPTYDEKFIKAKIKKFNDVVNTNFLGDKILKVGMHHISKGCISTDFVMKVRKKKNYPQVYIEECKYKIKKIKMHGFIDVELGSDSSSDSK